MRSKAQYNSPSDAFFPPTRATSVIRTWEKSRVYFDGMSAPPCAFQEGRPGRIVAGTFFCPLAGLYLQVLSIAVTSVTGAARP